MGEKEEIRKGISSFLEKEKRIEEKWKVGYSIFRAANLSCCEASDEVLEQQ